MEKKSRQFCGLAATGFCSFFRGRHKMDDLSIYTSRGEPDLRNVYYIVQYYVSKQIIACLRPPWSCRAALNVLKCNSTRKKRGKERKDTRNKAVSACFPKLPTETFFKGGKKVSSVAILETNAEAEGKRL